MYQVYYKGVPLGKLETDEEVIKKIVIEMYREIEEYYVSNEYIADLLTTPVMENTSWDKAKAYKLILKWITEENNS